MAVSFSPCLYVAKGSLCESLLYPPRLSAQLISCVFFLAKCPYTFTVYIKKNLKMCRQCNNYKKCSPNYWATSKDDFNGHLGIVHCDHILLLSEWDKDGPHAATCRR